MTILSASWVSPALTTPGSTPDHRPTLIIWGQRRAPVIAIGQHPADQSKVLAFDITTRPDAPMTCWRSIEQLKTLNSESEIKKAVKAMSDYVAQKDDVVILNDGDTAKVLEVVKGGLLVMLSAGYEIKITQDEIAGQLLNVPFELKPGAHVSLLTAPELPAWEDIPSGDDEDNLPELPADLWQAIETHYAAPVSDPMTADDLAQLKAGAGEPTSVDNGTVVDTVLNAANPYIDQITKLQNDLHLAQIKIGQLETDKFNAVREADQAREALAKAIALPKSDEVSALRRERDDLLAEVERLKHQKSAPAAAAPEQGFLPYFREQISTPDQADRAGRKLAALRAEGWKIRHEQFIQDGKLVYHVARLEKVERKPSPDYGQERAAVSATVPATAMTIFGGGVPGGTSTFNPANNHRRNPVPPMGFRTLSSVTTTPAPVPSMTEVHDALERGDITAEFAGIVTSAVIAFKSAAVIENG